MPSYPFLSDDWIEQAHAIRAEYRGKTSDFAPSVRMNLVVTELPFGEGKLDAHLDTSDGELELDKGHLHDPDLTVTVDYGTAREILVEGNAQAGMQAFMAGKVRVDGDMAKLMALTTGQTPDPAARELAGRIREITD